MDVENGQEDADSRSLSGIDEPDHFSVSRADNQTRLLWNGAIRVPKKSTETASQQGQDDSPRPPAKQHANQGADQWNEQEWNSLLSYEPFHTFGKKMPAEALRLQQARTEYSLRQRRQRWLTIGPGTAFHEQDQRRQEAGFESVADCLRPIVIDHRLHLIL